MSRITSKNLFYDNKPPPFLAQLRNTHALSDGRENNPIRPKKTRDPDQSAEEEPVYFDKGTRHTWTKKEWEAKNAKEEAIQLEENDNIRYEAPQSPKGLGSERNKIAVNGARKKRKSGRLVGAEVEKNQSEESPTTVLSLGTASNIDSIQSSKPKSGGKKAKGPSMKKIKLSFDD